MKTRNYLKIILAIFVGILAGFNTYATKFTIDVRDFEFSPSSLTTVRIGDTINWEWKEGTHTTTSTTIPAGAASWDQPITSSNQEFDYIPTVLGTYNYVCTPHVSSGMVGSFIVTAAAAVSEGPSPVSITLYPNPFTDKLTVRVQTEGTGRIEKVRVFDVTGKVISEYLFPEGDNFQEKVFTSAVLPEGMMFFEFRANNGSVYVRRVIRE